MLETKDKMVYFLLPVYNEEKSISRQLNSIKKFMEKFDFKYQIIVVNDGSIDGSKKEIEKTMSKIDIVMMSHSRNLGVGRAFKTGFDYLKDKLNDDDIVITMDTDNTQHLKTIELMINKINDGYEVVIGSVFAEGGMLIGVPFIRRLMTYCASLIYRTFFYIRGVRDYSSFYRAYCGEALKKAYRIYHDRLIESEGFSCMAEATIKFRQIPLFMIEVPMIVRYDFKASPSKLKILPTIRGHMRIIMENFNKRNCFHNMEGVTQ
jgi:dolichol-phosphate mannosyltransferase